MIVSTSDKAPANQRLYQMHGHGGEICYKSLNMFSPDRNIYFISDPPHLVKTVRNNLSSSGSGKNTKLLWKDGQHLLWRHIVDLYRRDIDSVLRRTKLPADHIHLNPHSVMNVRLAAQVLSHQVGSVMQQYGTPGSQVTTKFILLMDRFFDCLNSSNLSEADRTIQGWMIHDFSFCRTNSSSTLKIGECPSRPGLGNSQEHRNRKCSSLTRHTED